MSATAAELLDFRSAQSNIVTLARRELEAFWRTLDLSSPVETALALEAFMPELVQAYGEIGATVAADFYDELRERSPAVGGVYRAQLADATNVAQIRGSTKWAVTPLFKPRPDFAEQSLANVIQITDRFVKAHGRETLTLNVERDTARVRFARVPSGATTCAFCLMLASRGAVYHDDAEARHKYHGDCDCVPTPVFGDELPEGYDLDGLREKYASAASETHGGTKELLATLREQQSIR